MSELIERADRLAAWLAGPPAAQPDVTPAEESSRLADVVATIITRAEEGSRRASAAGERTADKRGRVAYWIDLMALALTAAFVWIGAGQLCLLARGQTLVRSDPRNR